MSTETIEVEAGQVWVDPDTGLGWTVVEDDDSGYVTLTAAVEQRICVVDVPRMYRLDPPDLEPPEPSA